MRLDGRAYGVLMKAIEELVERSENGAVVVVEGERDLKALRALGVRGVIVKSSNRPNVEVVESIGCGDVIIMTDWDRRGEKLKDDLVAIFNALGVVPDVEIRRRIFSILGRITTRVEDLPSVIERLTVGGVMG